MNLVRFLIFRLCISGEWMLSCDKDKKSGNLESEDSVEPKGDSEMAPVYLKRMLPVFCNTFQSTMLPSIR